MFFIWAVPVIVFLLLNRRLTGKYKNILELGRKKEYPLKSLYALPLFLLDKTGGKLLPRYNSRILAKLNEIYGFDKASMHLKLFHANRVLLLIMILYGVLAVIALEGINRTTFYYTGIVTALVLYLTDREIEEKRKKRRQIIALEFADFINKLVLLINAGMTVRKAWGRIADKITAKSPLNREIRVVAMDINSGKSEIEAYEDFAKRCRQPEITRFISSVIINLKRGNRELVSVLRLEAAECWRMRKHTALRMGEEASTKLLFPLMMSFLAILAIVITPAVLALRPA